MTDFVWTANRGRAGLEYFPIGQSLLVINTPAAIARVGECLDTMRLVRNTFVQVDVQLFKVPCETDSIKKVFGDKQTAAMTSEELTTLLDGLKKTGQIEMITEPKLVVGNNETGVFQKLQKLPRNDVPVGVSCKMTPSVTSDLKSIRLQLDVTNSTPSASVVQLGNGLKAQPVDSQQTATSVEMKNGGTFGVRLGIQKVEQRVEQKVPFLGDVPYVGRLFRNTGSKVQRMETIALFTASQVKPMNPSVYPPLPSPTPHLLPNPALQQVQALRPIPMLVARPEPTLADYHAACAAGQKDEAMYLARQLLQKDPTCFGQGK